MAATLIDWDFALATAVRLVKSGPDAEPGEAAEVVDALRAGAARSEGPVREFTGLEASSATAPVLVVDRPGWIAANVAAFSSILAPLLAKVSDAAEEKGQTPGPVARGVGSRVTGAEVGAALAFMSTKVLGQFDPFFTPATASATPDAPVAGRLMLVAPNVLHVERTLDVDPDDFRLWVCLHEETHRVQFTAVPWMRPHIESLVAELVEATEVDSEGVARSLSEVGRAAGRIARGEKVSLVELMQNDAQRAAVARITGVMSLLEGHADVVMDGVGPSVIPSVKAIRRKFDQRRKGEGLVDRLLRQVLGLDAKMKQYRDGAAFVRAVEKKAGRAAFDAVWAGPENLPSAEEIEDPDRWVRRVHG